jgi:membrane protein
MRALRFFYDVIKTTVIEWIDDKVPQMGAALAYYTVFSIAPFLVIVISVAGLIFGEEAARQAIAEEIQLTVGGEVAGAIDKLVGNAATPQGYTIATVVGVVVLLFGASGVFVQLQDSLNTIWKVVPKPGRGVRGVVRDRFLSFAVVLGTGFLLLVSLVFSAGLSALTKHLAADALPGGVQFWQLTNELVSLVFITLLFALIYKILPDAKIAWRHVWTGAAVTAVLFTIGKSLIGFYLGQSGTVSAFGAAGSLVVILVWVYYSAQIILFGAEFTRVLSMKSGLRIVPAENAMRLTQAAAPGKPGVPIASGS